MKLIFYKFAYWLLWLFDQILGSKNYNLKSSRDSIFKQKIEPYFNKENVITPIRVVVVDHVNQSTLKQYCHNEPVVLRGLGDRVEAIEKWNWDYLESKLKNSKMPFIDTTTQDKFHSGVKKGNELIHGLKEGDSRYSILFSNLKNDSSELMSDLSLDKWIRLKDFNFYFNKSWQVFFASKGKCTRLHSELGTTLSLQIKGRKRWIMFSHEQTLNINPKVNWKMYLESTAFFETNDFLNKKMGLNLKEAILEEGDILYFPACYWHHVENLDDSMSVSFKWTNIKSFFQLPLLSFILLSSRKPSAIMRIPFLKKFSSTYPPIG